MSSSGIESDDTSLLDLLSTFSTLGFTHSNLQKLKDDQQEKERQEQRRNTV